MQIRLVLAGLIWLAGAVPASAVAAQGRGGAAPTAEQEAVTWEWWVAHNSCAVAVGRALVANPASMAPDAYGIGVDERPGATTHVLAPSGVQVLGGAGWSSGQETLKNWDHLESLALELRTRQPPRAFQPIYLAYMRAIAEMRTASGILTETRIATWPRASLAADVARHLGVLEELWPDRPRVDLADCGRFYP
jgi:hypothetical protein